MASAFRDGYASKTALASLRKLNGKSSSALLRQANKSLLQSNKYLNIYRGASSVIGSGVSFWTLMR